MKKAFDHLVRLVMRFRYPVSLPEDVAYSLGIHLSNAVTFSDFIQKLNCPNCCPTKLSKFMPREKAERAFAKAVCHEKFADTTLCSFFFNNGWMEFVLKFDDMSRLRRIYVQHKDIPQDQGIEIKLTPEIALKS